MVRKITLAGKIPMQSFRNDERTHSLENKRLITPYSRRMPLTPYSFTGRNFVSPRGRIHSPGDAHRELDYKRKFVSSGVENLNPFGHRAVDANKGDNFGRELKAIHNREYEFPRNFDDFTPRFPVQMVGNSSVTESNIMNSWIPFSEKETIGKKQNPVKENESVQCQTSKTKSFNEDNQIRRREYQSRLLTGTVEKVLQWFKLKNNFNLLFEVMAPLIDIRSGKHPTEKCLLLRDEKIGPSLLATFYEIDRPLPVLQVGNLVRCIGRLTSRNCLQAFRVEQITNEEKTLSQRLFFMSNLVAEEAKSILNKKQ